MKPSTLFTSLLAVAITGAVADNCRTGYLYCAKTLNAIGTLIHNLSIFTLYLLTNILTLVGNYQGQIDQELSAKGFAGGESRALFYCVGGSSGVIRLEERCRTGCQQNGVKVNDVCF